MTITGIYAYYDMLYDIVLYILLPVSLEVPLSPGRDCEGTIVARVIVAGREAQGLRAAVRCLNNGVSLDVSEAAALAMDWRSVSDSELRDPAWKADSSTISLILSSVKTLTGSRRSPALSSVPV